ncbi:xaa-Pro aminopeptidase 1-like isoform X2 [Lycorma delicatula]
MLSCSCVMITSDNNINEEGKQRKLCPPMPNVPPPPERVDTKDRLTMLRNEMRKQNVLQAPIIDAYLIPSEDEHQSEYVAERDMRLKFISGFTGSAGTAIVTATKAALWTDGRYHAQADNELSCDWLLMGRGINSKDITDWLKDEIRVGGRIGADPALIANSRWEKLTKKLAEHSIYLLPVKNNLIDLIWTENRANYSKHVAYTWPVNYAGKEWNAKVTEVRNAIKDMDCDAIVITALDEIAWLLNIRGRDIPYNPVLRSYVILTKDQIRLYVNQSKLNDGVRKQLHTEGCFNAYCVRVHDYNAIWDDLRTLPQIWKRVLLPSATEFSPGVSRAVFIAIPVDKRKLAVSPIVAMKAKKNVVEREGMQNAHIRDAVAFCEFMSMLEEDIKNGGGDWSEMTVARKLDEERTGQNLTRGISFSSIVGFGPHGALAHYIPTKVTNIPIDKSSLLVIDSGGQYYDGSTDVTRTFHFGTPTKEEKEHYTRVLMGHIDLASFVFPKDFPMNAVDILARSPLWQVGLEYNHGTGHGIGIFLNIHEAPISLSWRRIDGQLFKEGYFFTDEPGYYKEGHYGIRLENVLEVVRKEAKTDSMREYLMFKPITLIPFDWNLIDLEMLSPSQKKWLNDYNKRIRMSVGKELKRQRKRKGYDWMISKTEPIPEVCCSLNSAKSKCFTVSYAFALTLCGISLIVNLL